MTGTITNADLREVLEAASQGYALNGRVKQAIRCYKIAARLYDLDDLANFREGVWFDNDQVALARGRVQTRRNWQKEPHGANVQLRLF